MLVFVIQFSLSFFQCEENKTQEYHYRYTLPDWAQLNYYAKANTAILPPIQNENRIVFMGNSITQSWKLFIQNFLKENPILIEQLVDRQPHKCKCVFGKM